jgi:hypothetical protein
LVSQAPLVWNAIGVESYFADGKCPACTREQADKQSNAARTRAGPAILTAGSFLWGNPEKDSPFRHFSRQFQ